MPLPPIERTSLLRLHAAEPVLTKASATIPVAPVNPAVEPGGGSAAPTPGVVNLVNPALQSGPQAPPNEGEPNYTSVPDPVAAHAAARHAPHDWTLQKPAAQKVEDPPRKPISEILMENLKSVWTASASAVQLEQVSKQLNPPVATQPTQVPGEIAKQVLTYQPSKIKKNEKL